MMYFVKLRSPAVLKEVEIFGRCSEVARFEAEGVAANASRHKLSSAMFTSELIEKPFPSDVDRSERRKSGWQYNMPQIGAL